VTAIAAGAVAVALRVLLRRPFGRVVAAIRENEERTQLLGYDVRLYKLAVFALGGGIAGLAGAGYAAWGQFINPAVFGLQQAALVVIWVLVGGRRSLLGAFVGAFLISWITTSFATRTDTQPILLGSVLIAIVLLLPRGLVPTAGLFVRRLVPWLRAAAAPPEAPARPGAVPLAGPRHDGDAVLETVEVAKSFGGLAAVSRVSLLFPEKGVHCLIGPNGAGKSTYFNLLAGRYRPSAGRIVLGGDDVTRERPDQRARRGIGIKLQVGSLYPELTCLENVWLAAYAATRSSRLASERAAEVLDWLGLLPRAPDPAGILSHGEQQWLEIGMVLAAEPAVVLLDEPTAGMTRDETAQTADLVTALGEHVSVVVVEHDMEFVRRLDVPVTVFHQGRIFARGSLDELRRDERVLDIYLGRRARAEA
jgi:branched-chain amino acid transport system permease protein